MHKKTKAGLWIVAVIAILFTIGLAIAAPAGIAQEPIIQEPVAVEIENQPSVDLPEFAGPAPAVNPITEPIVVETWVEASIEPSIAAPRILTLAPEIPPDGAFCPIGAPQSPQKRFSVSTIAPHLAQVSAIGTPQ